MPCMLSDCFGVELFYVVLAVLQTMKPSGTPLQKLFPKTI